MSHPLEDLFAQWAAAFQSDQELEARGVPPEAEARRRLTVVMDAYDEQIVALAVQAAQVEPIRDELNYTIPRRARARPQALWQLIN